MLEEKLALLIDSLGGEARDDSAVHVRAAEVAAGNGIDWS
jgi:hypothetical protein